MRMVFLPGILVLSTACTQHTVHKQMFVDPQLLYNSIEAADRLVVKDSEGPGAEVIFESTDKKDLKSLQNSLVITQPAEENFCMCYGSPAIYLYKKDKVLGVLKYHSSSIFGFSLWSESDALADTDRWLAWFDERNIIGPRKEVEEARLRKEENKKNWDRWLATMPQAIRPLWSDSLGEYGQVNVAPLSKALRDAVPDQNQQILALLEWFGSGAGPWSGCPIYEVAAEKMLLEHKTEDIVFAVKSIGLTPAQKEGAARLFGGWDFSQERPGDLQKVPDGIKKTLWDHVKSTQDKDKLARAKNAFKR
jgi:hypothetical protein